MTYSFCEKILETVGVFTTDGSTLGYTILSHSAIQYYEGAKKSAAGRLRSHKFVRGVYFPFIGRPALLFFCRPNNIVMRL